MKKLSLTDKIIFVFNAIAATVLLLSFVLPFLPPKAFSFLSVLSLSVPFLTLLNVLFFLYWLFKIKKQLLLSLLVLLLGYIFYGSFYKFGSSTDINNDKAFKVMNFNVRLFNLYDWIKEKDIDVKIENFIKSEAPDILCIQDYHPNTNIDFSFFKHKYVKLSGKAILNGQVILSKYPIINSGSLEFPNTANNAIFADVVKGKDTIRVYNIHLQSLKIDTNVEKLKNESTSRLFKLVESTFKRQQFQSEIFLLHKNQCPYKMIICGDFNNTAYSYVYRKIKGDLNDTFKEAGNGFGRTYDFKFFPVRIDFILADETFTVNKFKTFDEHLSDHYPIMTSLSLED
ncbi:MAG: endonuclease/exonuclease/phosphatase family protein [Flavobacteriales bacterium]|nr:endonuclease/exonuclease/phosphatase family protein [Flavobacteriia bacterium]NCP05979.1 endonuclease/exonuclease/phosphatase family protein [Flavobacteriales bacterium]PIV93995.1 MAG: endonuclease [Flavobacteriaceae bacterium CG17_big_fil_post_rev_8_21_14_2_50_33_15]PIY10143.1 MAG: endonuclease [Flavobacteriaceae bacterium CG_4_10_14_3_um_filter_33_47]PJB16304.1 MAG: endonuclease [Flavobacteriaceae bacterium CG_4_9_14_3_um_filter_33_16]